ncbi:hypothetical protein [Ascidiimonas sp. W6]|uniref:hypothetical protein n=1 Tax=Ascidiimonas meishanensis TaxID=3128903 RepID=UPI0030EC22A5
MNTTEVNKDLKNAIASVLDGIIEVSEAKPGAIESGLLKKIIHKNNRSKVLSTAGVRSVKQAYWEIVDEASTEENFRKLHHAEPYLNKGIALLSNTGAKSLRVPNVEIKDVKMPALNVEALEYRYNNDKESFSF